jgi:hypothetical protein
MREVFLDLSQDIERVKRNDGTVARHDISRNIAARETNLKKTLRIMIDQVLSISSNLQYQEEDI